MPLILDGFWPIWGIETKKLRKKIIFDLSNLKQYFFLTSARRASFWASLKKFDFFAISKSS